MSFSYVNNCPAAYYSQIEGNVIIFKLDACEKLTLAESLLVPGFRLFGLLTQRTREDSTKIK
jgi:hypothetical protein